MVNKTNQIAKDIALANNGKMLEQIGPKTFRFKCENGHFFKRSIETVKKGSFCPICSKLKELEVRHANNIKYNKEIAKLNYKYSLSLRSRETESIKDKLRYFNYSDKNKEDIFKIAESIRVELNRVNLIRNNKILTALGIFIWGLMNLKQSQTKICNLLDISTASLRSNLSIYARMCKNIYVNNKRYALKMDPHWEVIEY